MPACVAISDAMMNITNVLHITSEQHKDILEARRQRDTKDTIKLAKYVDNRNPFKSDDKQLYSIYNGSIAHKSVNVDQCIIIGEKIFKAKIGCKVEIYVFKKADRAVTMGVKVCSEDRRLKSSHRSTAVVSVTHCIRTIFS